MSNLIRGIYVRYPVIQEYVDDKYPRTFGLGQIINIDTLENTVTVRQFDLMHSKAFYPQALEVKKYLIRQVIRAKSPNMFPVKTPDGMGTILQAYLNKEKDIYVYYVSLPGNHVKAYPETQLQLDYSGFDIDPIESMARYELQNPTWFAARNIVSGTMHVLNNAVYGFRELTGCRVFLKPHQIETVLRCLQDDTMRYMLADEVGLGKTIEACSIVKIQKKRFKNYHVLYLVPYQLIPQWQFELRSKFNIDAIQGSPSNIANSNDVIIAIESIEDLKVSSIYTNFDLVVVDETHKILNNKKTYQILQEISINTKNILLLSATPISSRGEEYLRLLTLLDPHRYEKLSLTEFQMLVGVQQELTGELFQLFGDIQEYNDFADSIIDTLKSISERLKDKILDRLITKIDQNTDDSGKGQVMRIIAYICEHYRLEKNIIRNRRGIHTTGLANRTLVQISYPKDGNEMSYYEERTYTELIDWLNLLKPYPTQKVETVVVPLLSTFFSSSLAFIGCLNQLKSKGVKVPDDLIKVSSKWVEEEAAEINSIDSVLDDPDRIKSRLVYVMDYIEQEIDPETKVVVFTNYTETLSIFKQLLESRLKSNEYAIFSHDMNIDVLEENANRFQSTPSCRIILCDQTGMEGRNFQMADIVIHIDTPWSVNQIEQRIGRLDRTGRETDKDVTSVVVYSVDTIEEQLVSIWRDGIQLYNHSISGLEIISGDIEQKILSSISNDVHFGLRDSLEDIRTLMDSMKDCVEEEQFTDITPMLYNPLQKNIELVLDMYQGKEDEIFATSMMSWGEQAGFYPTKYTDENGHEIVEYAEEDFNPKSSSNAFFVPPDWNKYDMERGGIIGTFDRAYSIKREDLLFYAPGDAIFDSIIQNAMTSYRGRCAAFEINGAPVAFKGLVFTWNIGPNMRYMYAQKIDPIKMAHFRSFLPLEQIITLVPDGDEYINITASDIVSVFASQRIMQRITHLGRRGRYGDETTEIGQFRSEFPDQYWQKWLSQARATALAKAKEIVEEKWDIETAQEEASRIIHSREASDKFFGIDHTQESNIEIQYNAVIDALKHYKISLDSVVYVRIKP